MDEPDPPEERPTLAGLSRAVRPDEGETEEERVTVPVKLLRLARLIVDVEEDPAWKLTVDGLLETLKSGGTTTVAFTTTEWEIEPLVPVTVIA